MITFALNCCRFISNFFFFLEKKRGKKRKETPASPFCLAFVRADWSEEMACTIGEPVCPSSAPAAPTPSPIGPAQCPPGVPVSLVWELVWTPLRHVMEFIASGVPLLVAFGSLVKKPGLRLYSHASPNC
jgi:hypothetical protein